MGCLTISSSSTTSSRSLRHSSCVIFIIFVCIIQSDLIYAKSNEEWNLRSVKCDGETEKALGIESGAIPDESLTASSSYNEQSVGPRFARLNQDESGGAWCPQPQIDSELTGSEWIQVNLTKRFVVTGIATQGRFGSGAGVEFLEEYWVEYSRDFGSTWIKWRNKKGAHLFHGNINTFDVKRNTFDVPIIGANMVRIVPFSKYLRTVCLRFELYGCPFEASQQKLTQKIHQNRSTVKSSSSPPPSSSSSSSSRFSNLVMVGVGFLVLSFLTILIVTGYRYWQRSKRNKHVSSNHFYTVDTMNYGSGPDAKVATPVYCEPDHYDWRSTHHPYLPQLSSSVRNHHHEPQYIPIHEYAVPEVVYKQTSPTTFGPTIVNTSSTTSRIINNPLQEVVDSINRLKASYGITSSPAPDRRDVNSVSSSGGGADECLISTKDSSVNINNSSTSSTAFTNSSSNQSSERTCSSSENSPGNNSLKNSPGNNSLKNSPGNNSLKNYESSIKTQKTLTSIEVRKLRRDLIEIYRIINYFYEDVEPSKVFYFKTNTLESGGHDFMIARQNPIGLQDQRSFPQRVLNVWNSLPSEIVSTNSLVIFKALLDKYLEKN